MFSFSHPRSVASIAATVGTDQSKIPESLVAINPTNRLFKDANQSYRDRYAQELFGEEGFEDGVEKSDSYEAFKKQRKEMAKLTKKLLNPDKLMQDKKKLKEKMLQKKQEKAKKKRDKRKKKKKINKSK